MIRESFDELARYVREPLLLLAGGGVVEALNPPAAFALGREPSAVVGTRLADHAARQAPDDAAERARLERYLKLCSRSGTSLPGVLRLAGEDGEPRAWRCDGAALSANGSGAPMVLLQLRPRSEAIGRFLALNQQIEELHREIHHRRRLERERDELLARERRSRTEAERANRLKDDFLATVSHELRTPLHAVLGWVHLLRHQQVDEETLQRGLAVIDRNISTQRQLIDDLLDVSRIITGKMRLELIPLELAPLIEDAVDSIRPTATARRIRLETLLDRSAGPVTGDPDRLRQVLWNLLSNAVKFTPKGGRVQVVLQQASSHVEISVSDTGCGIPVDKLPYVFDRFQQGDTSASREHSGLGLGLAIARHLTELHGGILHAESEGEDRGATFTVSLPVRLSQLPELFSGEEPSVEEVPLPVPAEPPLDGLRVLVVEDHDDSRDLLVQMLRTAGAVVFEAESSAAALEQLDEAAPDLLVSDIGLPGEDGYTLIRKIRDLEGPESRMPAIALTAFASGRERVRALRSGFQAHLSKPVEPAELFATLVSLSGRS